MSFHAIIEQYLPKERKIKHLFRFDKEPIKDIKNLAYNEAVSKMRKSVPAIVESLIADIGKYETKFGGRHTKVAAIITKNEIINFVKKK